MMEEWKMIIDFHTHIYPDLIAARTIKLLEESGNIKAYTLGNLADLKRSMKENWIDISVVLPVATKPSQFETINSFAAQINNRDGILSFGGLHPDTENYREELDKIKQLGLLGIKLHPDYQKTYIDDPKMIRIIQYATELGLMVTIHGGLDIGLPNPIHCTPERAANMLGEIHNPKAKIILAHMGGYALWDEVEKHIIGKKVYLDTSYSLGMMEDEQFVRMVQNHGADRVLFATDSPWADQGETFKHLRKLEFTEEEFAYILYKNALKLLGMEETKETD